MKPKKKQTFTLEQRAIRAARATAWNKANPERHLKHMETWLNRQRKLRH